MSNDNSQNNLQAVADQLLNLTPRTAKKFVGYMLERSDETTVRATLRLLENLLEAQLEAL